MARVHILKWLYKHSPVNFYSITENGETIIKSINNISVGYKFDEKFSTDKIEKLRKQTKFFKRFSTIIILLSYIALVYGVIFPNYTYFEGSLKHVLCFLLFVIVITIFIAFANSKIYELFLRKKYGQYEKTHFPSSNSIEDQSYKDFKLELVKIFLLVICIVGVYFWIGSPHINTLNMITQGRYEDAVKMTTLWSKIIPNDPQWYSLRAYAKFHTGDFEGAVEDYDKAYNLENNEYKMMNFDNKIYVRYAQKNYKQALKDFDKEIENAQDEFDRDSFLWDKAQFLYNIERYKDALKIYDMLLVNSENDRIYLIENRLYYERAQVHLRLNNEQEAQNDMDKAFELNLDPKFQNPIPAPTLLLNN
ncbi:hypothetical protein IJ596_01970 [bacterium]|nr:hypothetical protein [bacterium]